MISCSDPTYSAEKLSSTERTARIEEYFSRSTNGSELTEAELADALRLIFLSNQEKATRGGTGKGNLSDKPTPTLIDGDINDLL